MSSPPSVLFLGSPYWCRYLADLYQDTDLVRPYTMGSAHQWILTKRKVVCLVGIGMPDTFKRLTYHAAAYLLDAVGFVRHRVIYWIGSDVLNLKPESGFVESCRNVAGSEWLAREVRELGYSCDEALFPVRLAIEKSMPFPDGDRLKVLCYVPDAHHELHGSSEIETAARKLSDVEFTVVGGNGNWWPDAPDNVIFTGWTSDITARIRESHVVLRRTAHDSLSAFVREGLVAERYVIFTYDYPGAKYVSPGDVDTLCRVLEDLSAALKNSTIKRNCLDREVWSRLIDTDGQLAALAAFYD